MSIPGAASPLFLATTAGAADAFSVSKSLRFNSGDSAYLNFTPSAAGNQKTWTWSGWFKKAGVGSQSFIFGTAGYMQIYFSTDQILVDETPSGGSYWTMRSTPVFRDPSAWYHCVFVYDSTQSTASNRFKVYVNNSEITSWVSDTRSNIVQNNGGRINSVAEHRICRPPSGSGASASAYANGYLAEVNFIDGQALAPTDFGETDDNGVWQAKEFTGVYSTADTTDNVYAWKATTSNGGNSGGWYFTQENNSSSIGLSGNTGGHPNELGSNTLGARTGQNVIGAYGTFATANSVSAGSSAISQDASFDTGTSTRSFVYNKTVNKVWVHNGSSWVGGGDPTNTSSTPTFSVPSSGKLSFGVSQNGTNEILTLAAIDSSVYSGTATGITFRGSYLNTTLSSGNTVATCSSGSGGYSDGWSIELLNNGTGENSYRLSFADNSGATATTLGKDTSGNSNNWTPNNLSIGLFRQYVSEGTVTGTFYTSVGGGVDKMFNGVGTSGNGAFSQTGTATFTFGGSAIVASTSLKIRAWKGDAAGANVLVNGTDVSSLLNAQSGGGYSTVDVTSTLGGAPITLANVSMVNAGGGSGSIAQIFVDGLELITGSPGENDSLVDSPTNGDTASDTGAGGEISGNYATFNPLRDDRSGYTEAPTNGNLETNPRGDFVSTIPVKSGKYYWEITIDTQGDPGQSYIGIVDQAQISTGGSRGWATSQIAAIRNGGSFYGDGSTGTAVTFAAGDILGFALDADSNKLWISKNGTYVNSGNPAGGTGHAFSGLSFSAYLFIVSDSRTGNKYTLNAGQRAYNTAAPTGFKTWCTTNLPTPTIANGSLYFDTKLYTSTGADLSVTGLQFSPDFVWVKNRATANRHAQFDIVRGPNKYISSTRTNAESTTSGSGYGTGTFNSFDTNGFTVGSDVGVNVTNYPSGDAHVAWAWDAGTSTVSNTDGSITSNVRANSTAGFSICTYTGNGTAGESVGHGLSAAPEFIICKCRNSSVRWAVYTKTVGPGNTLVLDSTGAPTGGTGVWGNVNPTNSVFTVGNDPEANGSGNTYVAYCFAPVNSYSVMGSFEGNGNSSGPFIYTGFKPSWIIIKNIDNYGSGYDWFIFDSKRDTYNTSDAILKANLPDIESDSDSVDILSNGFKLRATTNGINLNAHTHVYLAFASNPFQANGGLAR